MRIPKKLMELENSKKQIRHSERFAIDPVVSGVVVG